MGSHKKPFYRVVAADSRVRRDGPFLEIIGFYDPIKKPSIINIDVEKAKTWLGHGAQPTETVKRLFEKAGLQVS